MLIKYNLEKLKVDLDDYNELIGNILKFSTSIKDLEDELDIAQHRCIPVAYDYFLNVLLQKLEYQPLRQCVEKRKAAFYQLHAKNLQIDQQFYWDMVLIVGACKVGAFKHAVLIGFLRFYSQVIAQSNKFDRCMSLFKSLLRRESALDPNNTSVSSLLKKTESIQSEPMAITTSVEYPRFLGSGEIEKYKKIIIFLAFSYLASGACAANPTAQVEHDDSMTSVPPVSENMVASPTADSDINIWAMHTASEQLRANQPGFHEDNDQEDFSKQSLLHLVITETNAKESLLDGHFLQARKYAKILYDYGVENELVWSVIVVSEFENNSKYLKEAKFSKCWADCARSLLSSEPVSALGFYARSMSHFISTLNTKIDLNFLLKVLEDIKKSVKISSDPEAFLQNLEGYRAILEKTRAFARTFSSDQAKIVYRSIIDTQLSEKSDWENFLETYISIGEYEAGIAVCHKFMEEYGYKYDEFSIAYLARAHAAWSYRLKKTVEKDQTSLQALKKSPKFLEIKKNVATYVQMLKELKRPSRVISYIELGYHYSELAEKNADCNSCCFEAINRVISYFDRAVILLDKEKFVPRDWDAVKKDLAHYKKVIAEQNLIATETIFLDDASKVSFDSKDLSAEQSARLLEYGYRAIVPINALDFLLENGKQISVNLGKINSNIKLVFAKTNKFLAIFYAYADGNQLIVRRLIHMDLQFTLVEGSPQYEACMDFLKKEAISAWITPSKRVIKEKPEFFVDTVWKTMTAFGVNFLVAGGLQLLNGIVGMVGNRLLEYRLKMTSVGEQHEEANQTLLFKKVKFPKSSAVMLSLDQKIDAYKKNLIQRHKKLSESLTEFEKIYSDFSFHVIGDIVKHAKRHVVPEVLLSVELKKLTESIANKAAVVVSIGNKLEIGYSKIEGIVKEIKKIKTMLAAWESKIEDLNTEKDLEEIDTKLRNCNKLIDTWKKLLDEAEKTWEKLIVTSVELKAKVKEMDSKLEVKQENLDKKVKKSKEPKKSDQSALATSSTGNVSKATNFTLQQSQASTSSIASVSLPVTQPDHPLSTVTQPPLVTAESADLRAELAALLARWQHAPSLFSVSPREALLGGASAAKEDNEQVQWQPNTGSSSSTAYFGL